MKGLDSNPALCNSKGSEEQDASNAVDTRGFHLWIT
jgi:hypothetical protein